jgi:hypothetical protein
MSNTLEKALSTVILEPGTSYSCEVHGLPVRVKAGTRPPSEDGLDIESDAMIDPWTGLPRPRPTLLARGWIVAMKRPDPPPFFLRRR